MRVKTTIQEAETAPGKKISSWNIELGRLGEAKVVELLQNTGWRMIAMNWRCGRFGEIDLIARDCSRMLVFCEIKTRCIQSAAHGLRNEGFESVHWKKRRKIVTCAMNYIRAFRPYETNYRFDVIAVEYLLNGIDGATCPESRKRKPSIEYLETLEPTIRHVENAFC